MKRPRQSTRSGDLRHRILFESPSPSVDGYGNTVSGWSEEFTAWARIMPLQGGEDVVAARLQGRQPVVIQVRSSDDTKRITPDWRATEAETGTIYAIRTNANMDERNRFRDILAETGVAT